MGFKIELTPRGEDTYYSCLEYLLYYVGGFGNIQAAKNFILNYEKALDFLESNANGYPILDSLELGASDYRKIHFARMSYKIIFHTKDETVFIDAILHDKQSLNKALNN